MYADFYFLRFSKLLKSHYINVVFVIKKCVQIFIRIFNESNDLLCFSIINNFIIFIYACVTFENINDSSCDQYYDFLFQERYILRYFIQNPNTKIYSTTCEENRFDQIWMIWKSFVWRIMKQWLIIFFGHHKDFYDALHLNMTANDWSDIEMFIHEDVYSTKELHYIDLYLKCDCISCTVGLIPSYFYTKSYMEGWCRDFITYIDCSMYKVSYQVFRNTDEFIV